MVVAVSTATADLPHHCNSFPRQPGIAMRFSENRGFFRAIQEEKDGRNGGKVVTVTFLMDVDDEEP